MRKKLPVPAQICPGIPPLAVSRKEAARLLSVHVQTIDGLISSGKLRASRIGVRVIVRLADINALLDTTAMVA